MSEFIASSSAAGSTMSLSDDYSRSLSPGQSLDSHRSEFFGHGKDMHDSSRSFEYHYGQLPPMQGRNDYMHYGHYGSRGSGQWQQYAPPASTPAAPTSGSSTDRQIALLSRRLQAFESTYTSRLEGISERLDNIGAILKTDIMKIHPNVPQDIAALHLAHSTIALPHPLPQLSRQDCPAMIKFYNELEWKPIEEELKKLSNGRKAQKGKSQLAKGVNVTMKFITDEFGDPVDGTTAAQMRATFSSLVVELRDLGVLPAKWGEVKFQAREYIYYHMARSHPELLWCRNNWKTDKLARMLFSQKTKKSNSNKVRKSNLLSDASDDEDDLGAYDPRSYDEDDCEVADSARRSADCSGPGTVRPSSSPVSDARILPGTKCAAADEPPSAAVAKKARGFPSLKNPIASFTPSVTSSGLRMPMGPRPQSRKPPLTNSGITAESVLPQTSTQAVSDSNLRGASPPDALQQPMQSESTSPRTTSSSAVPDATAPLSSRTSVASNLAVSSPPTGTTLAPSTEPQDYTEPVDPGNLLAAAARKSSATFRDPTPPPSTSILATATPTVAINDRDLSNVYLVKVGIRGVSWKTVVGLNFMKTHEFGTIPEFNMFCASLGKVQRELRGYPAREKYDARAEAARLMKALGLTQAKGKGKPVGSA
ncbi:hypothetical protein GGG16DRAFT_116365 [Schizophyllum commune]